MVSPSPLSLHTPSEIQALWSGRLRDQRLRLGWRQQTLAERSGVSVATVRRFEKEGQITLSSLLSLCLALGQLDQCTELFQPPPLATMDELDEVAQRLPQRGRQ